MDSSAYVGVATGRQKRVLTGQVNTTKLAILQHCSRLHS